MENRVTAADVVGLTTAPTVQGEELSVSVDGSIHVDGARVTSSRHRSLKLAHPRHRPGAGARSDMIGTGIGTPLALELHSRGAALTLAGRALTVRRPDGAIVNISVIAEQNLPGMSADGASKALAGRPIAGRAPALGPGTAREHVASVICDALEQGTKDLPSDAC